MTQLRSPFRKRPLPRFIRHRSAEALIRKFAHGAPLTARLRMQARPRAGLRVKVKTLAAWARDARSEGFWGFNDRAGRVVRWWAGRRLRRIDAFRLFFHEILHSQLPGSLTAAEQHQIMAPIERAAAEAFRRALRIKPERAGE